MSGKSIFATAALDRALDHWEDHLLDLTPVEVGERHWYKRDDAFAPLGYGGINGSKLRQLIWLIDRARRAGAPGIVTGASVLSPQVSMTALVARHFGLPCVVVLGATKPASAIKHENVAIAAAAGAEFVYAPVAYNPALQRSVERLQVEQLPEWYRLCYGITTPGAADDAEIEAFHRLGAAQVANLPDEVSTLVMTAGSCNSCASVLYGIALHRPKLERVVLLGIGPTRLGWLDDRLAAIERASAVAIRPLFARRYHDDPDIEQGHLAGPGAPYRLEHWNLHTTKFAAYADRMPWTADGIEMHPTYEGKALAYMNRYRSRFAWWHEAERDVAFWIVGSAPSRAAMPELATRAAGPRR